MIFQTRIPPGVVPDTWFGRVVAALIAGSLAVAGLFFLAFALVAGALIVAVVLIRLWWVARKLRARRDARVIEGSYSVEAESMRVLRAENTECAAPPPDSR